MLNSHTEEEFCKPSALLPFTVIELIIVITVLISALSIIIPLIYNGTQRSKVNTCASNLRQLGIWVHLYGKTSNGYLPAYEDGWINPIANAGGKTVDQTVKPSDEFACPSQPFKSFKKGIKANDYWRGSYYGLNQHIASKLRDEFGDRYPQWTQIKIKNITDPSTKVILADATGSNFFRIDGRDPTIAGISMDGASFVDSLPPEPAIPLPLLRHMEGAGNFLFLDGHVELKYSWPMFMEGPGTGGYYFWSGEHQYKAQ